MVLRSNDSNETIGEFGGVNNLFDQIDMPPELVRWSFGGYYNEKKRFQRIQGKLLNSTTTSTGRIMDIYQLEFDQIDVVVFHSSNQIQYETDLSLLVSSSSAVSPLVPFV